MNTENLVITMFCKIDDKMKGIPKHSQASLYPSEIVTLACLFVLKGKGTRAFYRWVRDNYRHLFPKLPHRTRLFRLFATHRDWSDRLLSDTPSVGHEVSKRVISSRGRVNPTSLLGQPTGV
mgnify:CR=1 FL=1